MFGNGSVIVNWECAILPTQKPSAYGQKEMKDNINKAE